jgi:branched-chain amino acid transport system permease protein
MALMFPEFFGGEGGITTDRVYWQQAVLRHHVRPAIQVYYLIACTALSARQPCLPSRARRWAACLNAVRDNPERVEFIGYNTQRCATSPSSLRASLPALAAGWPAINFEIVTEVVSVPALRGLPAVHLPGRRHVLLWPHHWCRAAGAGLGAAVRADQGLAAVPGAGVPVHGDVRAWRRGQPDHDEPAGGQVRQAAPCGSATWALGGTGAGGAVLGAAAMVEMTYHLQLNAALGPELNFMGATLNAKGLNSWFGAGLCCSPGWFLFELCRRQFVRSGARSRKRSNMKSSAGRRCEPWR